MPNERHVECSDQSSWSPNFWQNNSPSLVLRQYPSLASLIVSHNLTILHKKAVPSRQNLITMPLIIQPDDASVTSTFDVTEIKTYTTPRNTITCVSINERANVVHEVPRVGDSDRQRRKLWFTREELAIIKQTNKLIIQCIKLKLFEESETHSSRGLERNFRSKDAYKRSVSAVLEQQEYQKLNGYYFPKIIALNCSTETSNCVKLAVIRAKRDAEELYLHTKMSKELPSPIRAPNSRSFCSRREKITM